VRSEVGRVRRLEEGEGSRAWERFSRGRARICVGVSWAEGEEGT
jgi:hypothetical protein